MDEFELNISDIPKICRACLKEKTDMKPINAKLKLMLNSIADIKIKNVDGMPKLMCSDCVFQVDRAFVFRQLVKKSDIILKKMFMQKSNKKKHASTSSYLKINKLLKNEDYSDVFTSRSNDPLAVTYFDREQEQENNTKIQNSEKITDNQCPPQFTETTEISSLLPSDVVDVTLSDKPFCKEESEIKSYDKLNSPSCISQESSDNQSQSSDIIIKQEMSSKISSVPHKQNLNLESINNSKPFKCKKCYLAFETQLDLMEHEKIHTDGEMRCRFCCILFDTKKRLMTHEENHLSIGRKYTCNVCDKVFTKSGGLSVHMRVHPEYQPFQCEICNKRFASNSAFKMHKATHLKEMKFPCKLCNQNFTTNSELVIHMTDCNHDPVKKHLCSICGKLFEHRHNLVRHLRVHGGGRPFKCDICDATFTQSSSLKVHMRSHTNERPYTPSPPVQPVYPPAHSFNPSSHPINSNLYSLPYHRTFYPQSSFLLN